MPFGRCAKSGLRLLHNGKGRPVQSKCFARSVSSQQFRLSPLLRQRALPSEALVSSRCSPSLFLQGSRRFASTTQVAPTPVSLASPVDPAPPLPTVENATSNEWQSLFDNLATNNSSIEPHIGYLKELGINFGWGTSSIVQWVVEHVHVYSGLPWFGSILASVLLFRVAILRYNIKAADSAGRMAIITPHLKPLQDKMKEYQITGDQAGMAKTTQELKALYKSANVKPLSMFVPVLLQIPLGFGMWRVTRSMADLPVPGLDQGGMWWFLDLTIPDPYYIIPLVTSGAMFYSFKRGGEMGSNTSMSTNMRNFSLYVLPPISFFITLNFPAATQVSFVATSFWSLIQTSLMRAPAVRNWLQIQPLPPAPAAPSGTGNYAGTLSKYEPPGTEQSSNSLGARWRTIKASSMDWMTSTQRKRNQAKRISDSMRAKAKRYEKERRAEIEAAKERMEKTGKRKRKV